MKVSELPTYEVAIYQSRAQRVIRTRVEGFLRTYNLTVMQWSVLGFVHEAGAEGVRISDLAKKIDTSLAFITNSINTLEAKGMVYRVGHAHDNRAKLVFVHDDYKQKIGEIEHALHQKMQDWIYKNIKVQDLVVYFKVLKQISNEGE